MVDSFRVLKEHSTASVLILGTKSFNLNYYPNFLSFFPSSLWLYNVHFLHKNGNHILKM